MTRHELHTWTTPKPGESVFVVLNGRVMRASEARVEEGRLVLNTNWVDCLQDVIVVAGDRRWEGVVDGRLDLNGGLDMLRVV